MTTFAELSDLNALSIVPQSPRENVRLLWHADFWDGPLSGMLEFEGEQCWFEMLAENEDDEPTWFRRFAILRLSPEQLADEIHWHNLFRQHVGGHTDYNSEQERSRDAVKPREQWRGFYDEFQNRPTPDYSANLVLSWFEM